MILCYLSVEAWRPIPGPVCDLAHPGSWSGLMLEISLDWSARLPGSAVSYSRDFLLQNKLRRYLLKWFFLTLCFVVGSYVKSFTVWIWIRREQNFTFRCIKYVFQIDSSQLPQSIDNISIQSLSIQGSVRWVKWIWSQIWICPLPQENVEYVKPNVKIIFLSAVCNAAHAAIL